MAVFIKKPWNRDPVVLPRGTGVRFSREGYFLYVVNEQGTDIAKFNAKAVSEYWIEANGNRVDASRVANPTAL